MEPEQSSIQMKCTGRLAMEPPGKLSAVSLDSRVTLVLFVRLTLVLSRWIGVDQVGC
ncbi:hypothetical protein SMD44_06669 [Streptomyces alboflavus]|uniref:Uncharacterized protein n=1 Tax=Streptomyces alboflavus TaxID=67267 RepID=A0A1Z1WLB1_9ACTN|nr:hypothetical protein SMD44_06669 [Streptomyces alboflavus]